MIKIKLSIFLGLVVSIMLSMPTATQALTIEEVINPQTNNSSWVTDMANILSARTETELNRLITKLEQTNGAEIAVVTVPETTPADSPKTFATQLFNYWGIGKAESNNGILFLISTGDKRVEIETGYGIEEILPNAKVGKIIDTKITPQYKQGNYDRGTLDGTKALIGSLNGSIKKAPTLVQKVILGIKCTLAGEGIAVLAMISMFFWLRRIPSKVLIDPYKTITRETLPKLARQDFYKIFCLRCERLMVKVDDIELTKIQQVAQKIGSVSYQGYKCSNCNQDKSLQPYTLVAYIANSSRYQKCPKCQEFTVTRTEEILSRSSYENEGKKKIEDTCNSCEYTSETIKNIPIINYSSSSSSHSVGGGSSSGFGGGSSDGGGAGGSW